MADLRLKFDEDCLNYDRWRPRYVEQLYEDIAVFSKLDEHSRVVEVGIGTGQATAFFLESGCELTAIELGPNLAEFVRDKYRDYPNLKVANLAFEEFPYEPGSVNLVYSATAFHWIPEDVGYPQVFDMLKSGGTIALFWNKPSAAREDDPLHIALQRIYQEYRDSGKRSVEYEQRRYERIQTAIRDSGFIDLDFRLYHSARQFNAEDYVALLNTYSDHRSMTDDVRPRFEAEIKEAINTFGGTIEIHDTIDLYMARKP